ncbi:solute carrier organic anion transporter family member 4A1-like isoform X1 [Lytechinus pictus]|uniref:solute carrier organic anion transporter family member 4A1-like isoform X1 n=1 Tax=Lytechinus pictus TaxID=7653 RepID=UPI0030BA2237
MSTAMTTDSSPLLSSDQHNEYNSISDESVALRTSSSQSLSITCSSREKSIHDVVRSEGRQRFGCFSLRPSWLQCCNNPKGFLVWLCGFAFTQSYVTSGIVYTVTTTLEQRFSLPSVQSGFLASCYDLALLVVVLGVTYFGENGNKPLWLGNGALIFAAGSFLFALPQFTTGLYEPSTLYSDTCDPTSNVTNPCDVDDNDNTTLSSYYWVFIAAQCLHGLGAAPIYTLGVTYIDESVSPHMASIYLGIIQATSILGPALGYLLGGYFLSIYVDPGEDPESLGLTPDSVLWVGAWWIGFITSGCMALIVTLPLLGFPKYLPDAKNIDGKLDHHQTQKGSEFITQTGLANSVRDIPRATLNLVTNKPFMLLNCSAATEWFIISCLAAFGPKFFESQFSLSSSDAAFQTGLIVIPSSCVGCLIGAFLVKHFKLSFSGMVKFCIGSLMFSLACMSLFLTYCPDPPMAGATVQYYNTSIPLNEENSTNFTAECNSNCHCAATYNPVCGSNGVVYFSACFAGCTKDEYPDDVESDRVYQDCKCIQDSINHTEYSGSAVLGLCEDEFCDKKPLFMAGLFFALGFTFLALVPSILATMRSVSHSQRAYGLGIQSFIYRLLGTVPGPIILGALIDRVCLVWESNCDGSRSCWLYDNQEFSKIFFIVTVICRCLSLIFMILSLMTYVPQGNEIQEEEEGIEEHEEGIEENSQAFLTSQTTSYSKTPTP